MHNCNGFEGIYIIYRISFIYLPSLPDITYINFLQPTLRMYLYPAGYRFEPAFLGGKIRGFDSLVATKTHRRKKKTRKRNGAILYAQSLNDLDIASVAIRWAFSLFTELSSRRTRDCRREQCKYVHYIPFNTIPLLYFY